MLPLVVGFRPCEYCEPTVTLNDQLSHGVLLLTLMLTHRTIQIGTGYRHEPWLTKPLKPDRDSHPVFRNAIGEIEIDRSIEMDIHPV